MENMATHSASKESTMKYWRMGSLSKCSYKSLSRILDSFWMSLRPAVLISMRAKLAFKNYTGPLCYGNNVVCT